jgi:hypothetical protein
MAKGQYQNKMESTLPAAEKLEGQSLGSEGRFFEIHVKGHLNHQWSDWLDGLDMKLLENGEMILSGSIVDQAALMGILNKLSRLNLTILSFNDVKKRNEEK